MADVPTFDLFYRAVHGREPFPWQRRLAARVGRMGWPSHIGVPTGLGKTACLDIAVWALAAQAALVPSERTAATRIWYVVNRRLLVDSAADHANHLAKLLRNPADLCERRPDATDGDIAVIADVADALASIAALGSRYGPLHVTRLRGGAELGARPPDPSQPTVVLATVPMFASRWLFRGYGSSRSMRPVDAAHAGIDALVLLDEAHLARPLADLRGPLAQCDVGDPEDVLCSARARPHVVRLTATGEATPDRFDLDDEDRGHPIERERLAAAKPVDLVEAPHTRLAAMLADQAVGLLDGAGRPASCVVFTNAPGTARAVHDKLDRLLGERADVRLLTGRTRDRESDAIRRFVLNDETGAPSGRGPRARGSHLVVVATQTLEVGADLDFDLLVTETASVRAVVQRFGRLNRLGQRNDVARAAICHPTTFTPSRLYGDEPAEVWDRLQRASRESELLDLGPGVVADILGEPADVPPASGELLPFHLWEWAKTSVPPTGEAPGRVFYEGLEPVLPTVSVAWRGEVPPDGGRLVPPLRGDEAVELPIWELAEALERREAPVCRLADDRATVEHVSLDVLAPGNQVILSVGEGRYDRHGWAPTSEDVVLDVAPLRDRTLVLSRAGLAGVIGRAADAETATRPMDTLAAGPRDDVDDVAEWERELVAELLAALRDLPPHPWLEVSEWHAFIDALTSGDIDVVRPALEGDDLAAPYVQVPREARARASVPVRADAFDELSFGEDVSSAELGLHLRTVGASAAAIAERIGLPANVVEAVEQAGRYHDLGKAESRFQRWLDPDNQATVLLAKSSTPQVRREKARIAAGWPKGGRHELLSARLLEDALSPDTPDRDLVVHLVTSHHGHGRPTVPVVADDAPTKVRTTVEDLAADPVSGDLSQPDWDQPRRFRRLCERYGYWGLALLEAVIRQADHAASAAATRPDATEVL